MNLGLDATQLNVVVLVFLLNLALGILVAIREKQFEWAKIANILSERFLPLGGGYVLANVLIGQFSLLDPALPKTAIFLALSSAMAAHLYNQIREMGLTFLPEVPWIKKPTP